MIGHSDNHNPYTPSYNPITDYRGNLTQITRYADAVVPSGAVTETRRYDIDGNVIKTSSSCCEQTTTSYTVDTWYTYPVSQTRGSATDPYSQVTTSATYDFNAGLVLSGTDANGRSSQTTYFPETLRLETTTLPTLAHTHFAYDDTAMSVTQTTYLESHPEDTTIATENVQLLDGRGLVRQEQARGENNVWDFVDTIYDNMGRASQQTRPYRNGETLRWATMTYDALGRTKKIIAPDYTLSDFSDGSTREAFYNEVNRPSVASTAPGETVRQRDAWGRERWARMDAQGRMVEVVEPAAPGSGSVSDPGALLTTYSYDTLGHLTETTQNVQTRLFKYDSLGRLVAQKLAETKATLNDAGIYQTGGGTWSDVFVYDDRSNLTARTDARGVKVIYNYNNDPLNRLQSISWDTAGFGDSANPILPTSTVNYAYRTKDSPTQLRDVSQPSSITTSGISSESYDYDLEGRASNKTLTLNSRTGFPFVTDFTFDSLGRVTDVTYPAEYTNGQQPRKVAHSTYDVASRLTGLTISGATQASLINYNAASQITSMKVGATGVNQITENNGFDSQTGLLATQTVVGGTSPSATTLLDLSYDYVGANGKRTGQLTKILNNLTPNHNKDRSYTYDALGRLTQATGGAASAPLWTQTYSYDLFGNRTGVSASGFSAKLDGSDPQSTTDNRQSAKATGSPGTAAANGTLSLPRADRDASAANSLGVDASGPSTAPAGPGDRKIAWATEQLGDRSDSESSGSRRARAPRSTSNSHHASRSAVPSPAPPQGAPPPVFTDPDLLATGGIQIKALHITELRTAINALRARLGLPAYSWQTTAASGGPITADPILEMRTALNQALGAPPAGYSAGLAQYLPVQAIHIQELRDRVVTAWIASSSIPSDGLASVSYELTSNRITTDGFDYDKAGNQVRALAPGGGSQRFQYDAANRLVRVKSDDNQTVISSYTYGSNTERLIVEEGGLRTYYACGGSMEYFESGASTTPQWSKSYFYLGSRLLSTLTPNGSGGEAVQYHHPDRLGTRLVTNAQDTSSFEQITLPFGTALTAESTGATTRRFTSYDRSATTGLDYATNRHYDSRQGRFTQVDPLGMAATNLMSPQTLNLYSYCGNDPVNRTDASGLFWGKLWRALKKIITNKWFIIAITVALVVITIGSTAFGWQLLKAVMINIGGDAPGAAIMIASGQMTATALGWVASALAATLAVASGSISFSAKAIAKNALLFAAGAAVHRALSLIPSGAIGPGGTPPFSFQATEQALSQLQANLVWQALEEARRALESQKCRDYVGPAAYAELRKLWDARRITYFPGVVFAPDEGEVWAANRGRGTFRGGSFSPRRIVLGYHFFNDKDVAESAGELGITPLQRRATTLLHEIRHVLGTGYVEPHDQWSIDIAKNCFK